MEIGSVNPTNPPVVTVPGMGKSEPVPTLPTAGSPTPMEQEALEAAKDAQIPEKQRAKVEDAVDKLNKASLIFDRSLRFQIHSGTKETMVSVVDMNNQHVIREIPSKEVLDIVSRMNDYLGMIFDKKA